MITKGIGQETSLSKQNKDMGLLTSGQMALGSHELFDLTCFYLYPHHLGGCGTDQPFQDLSTQRHVRFMWNFTGNELVLMQLVENALGGHICCQSCRGVHGLVRGTWLWKERVMLDPGGEKVPAHGFTILLACPGRSGQGKGYCSAGKEPRAG